MAGVRRAANNGSSAEQDPAAAAAEAEEERERSLRIIHHREQMEAQAERLSWVPRPDAWIWLTVAAIVAFVLAAFRGGKGAWPNLQNALALFPSGLPVNSPTDTTSMVIARYLAAAVSLFVTFRVLRVVFSEGADGLRARFRRDHVVVCGLGVTGLRSVRALLADRRQVTCLELERSTPEVEQARAAGALVLRRDFTSRDALEAAGVQRAARVVCAGPSDATNARVGVTAARLVQARGGGRRVQIHVGVDNPDLSQLLRGPLASVGNVRMHFFSESQVWARALVDDAIGPFQRRVAGDLTVAVVGDTELAHATAVIAARRWHDRLRTGVARGALTIVVVGEGAQERSEALLERYPAVARVATLRPIAHAFGGERPFPTRLLAPTGSRLVVYMCLADASANLALALDVEHRLGDQALVLVPAIDATETLGPLLRGVGRIHPVALPADASAIDLLLDEVHDELAREVHETYLAARAADPGFSGADPAIARGSTSMRPRGGQVSPTPTSTG